MDNSGTATTAAHDQADEEILTYTVSDAALEAGAGAPLASVKCDTISDTACVSCFPGCKGISSASTPLPLSLPPKTL
jgi:hypothetical protein